MSKNNVYRADTYGKKEVEMMRRFYIQKDDARDYFLACIRPRLDRSYKLYIQDNSDRAQQIQPWQSNVFCSICAFSGRDIDAAYLRRQT